MNDRCLRVVERPAGVEPAVESVKRDPVLVQPGLGLVELGFSQPTAQLLEGAQDEPLGQDLPPTILGGGPITVAEVFGWPSSARCRP